MWSVASLEKTWGKSAYFDRRETLGFAFLVAMASLVAIVNLVMKEEFGRQHLQLPWRVQLIW